MFHLFSIKNQKKRRNNFKSDSWFMDGKTKILLVDDEEDILRFIKYNLEKEGYIVETAINGQTALGKVNTFNPHLMLLDINMPEMDGIEVCKKIRSNKQHEDLLICFLTARSESLIQIQALDTGGDDFISKPIKPSVLLSRIKAIMRRHSSQKNIVTEPIIVFGELTINYEHYEVQRNGLKINLAKKEFELLKLITSKRGKVFKRTEILNKVWGSEVIVGDRTIDVHIRKLREKIGSEYIHTIKGVGYKFEF